MKPALISAFAIAGLATVALAGCGGTSSGSREASASSSSAGDQDTCSLLTNEEIRTVMDVAPGPSKLDRIQCIWPSADGSNEFLVQLLVAQTLIRSYDDLEEHYREELNTDAANAVHPLQGVDRFGIGFNDMPMVQIYTSSRMVQVATFGHEEKHALALAKLAAARVK